MLNNSHEHTSEHKTTTRNWYRILVVVFVIIIALALGIFFSLRYLYAESKDPASRVGQLWIDLRTTSDSDVDQDGLSNADEKVYATDFWVPDTDGDGFSDGQEVQNGFNPTGDGRLDDKEFSFDISILGN